MASFASGGWADGALRWQFDQHTGIAVTSPIACSPDAAKFIHGTYEGTVVLDSLGNVSFIVQPVPEPSVALMLGLTACVIGFTRRRPTVAA